jgi:hypothetical protein
MDVAVSIVVIVILILAFFLFRRTKATTKRRPTPPSRVGKAQPDPKFHAVSLEISGTACEAAKALGDKRFLASAAPHIPLPECDAPDCNCHFIHHDDRRVGLDRRKQYRKVYSGFGEQAAPIKEKRHRGDRRNNDPEDFFS